MEKEAHQKEADVQETTLQRMRHFWPKTHTSSRIGAHSPSNVFQRLQPKQEWSTICLDNAHALIVSWWWHHRDCHGCPEMSPCHFPKHSLLRQHVRLRAKASPHQNVDRIVSGGHDSQRVDQKAETSGRMWKSSEGSQPQACTNGLQVWTLGRFLTQTEFFLNAHLL
ncbi:uncharacterized protein LOC144580796 [Callithrix jacchus]